jgi:hypothetical protein
MAVPKVVLIDGGSDIPGPRLVGFRQLQPECLRD